jgi:uncharacterized membrane protein YeaQ/YmgE (transglycosylase-associated protein family)
MTSPAGTLLLILIIGVVIGLLVYRYAGANWLSHLTGSRRGQVTSAIVGIAGAFIGYNLAILFGAVGSAVTMIFAAVGAAVLVWGWQTIKF